MKRKKDAGISFLSDVRGKEWLAGILISLPMVLVPVVIFALYSGYSLPASSAGAMLVIAFSLMIAGFFRERRVKKKAKKTGLSDFQKIVLGLIVVMLALDAIAIALFLTSPPKPDVEKQIAQLETEYQDISAYYDGKMGELTLVMQDNMESGDYAALGLNTEEYERLKNEFVSSLTGLCDMAGSRSVDLESTESLWELSIICENRDLISRCNAEDIDLLKKYADFFGNIENRTSEDCLDLLELFRGSDECISLSRELGVEEETDFTDFEQMCNQMGVGLLSEMPFV